MVQKIEEKKKERKKIYRVHGILKHFLEGGGAKIHKKERKKKQYYVSNYAKNHKREKYRVKGT